MALNEADACRRYVVRKIQVVGWDDEPHRTNERVTFTNGRTILSNHQGRHGATAIHAER